MSPPSPTLAIFTPRQRQLLDLAAAGHSLDAIARIVGISAWTVRHHFARAAAHIPETFYPALLARGPHGRTRLLMYYALAVDREQYHLVA